MVKITAIASNTKNAIVWKKQVYFYNEQSLYSSIIFY